MRVTEASAFRWCLVPIGQATVTSPGPLPWKAVVWFSRAESHAHCCLPPELRPRRGGASFCRRLATPGQEGWIPARADANLAVIAPLPCSVGSKGLCLCGKCPGKK